LILSNNTKYIQKYGTADELELFRNYIKDEGGDKNASIKVNGVNAKGCKLSLSYFTAEIRKRIVLSVSNNNLYNRV
jgi:hypothetical protein